MSVTVFQLKTHIRLDRTREFPDLHECVIHKRKPCIMAITAGRNKEVYFVAICEQDECNKISSEGIVKVVDAWNKWNPKP